METLENSFGHRELCNLIIPSLPIGFVAISPEGRIVEFNREAEKLLGYARKDVIGRRCRDVLRSGLCDAKCPLTEDYSRIGVISEDTFIISKDENRIPVTITVTPIEDAGGKQYGIIELIKDRREKERLEKHRDILISMFAHDLKTPVAVAGGLLSRLLAEKAGKLNEKQRTYLQTIHKEIQRLENYIHVILEILRMEAGKVPLSTEECAIEELLDEVLNGINIKASEKAIKIQKELPDEVTVVNADAKQIQRVMTNLLDNAIKFSPKGSEINVRVRPLEHAVIFEVEDQGPGIDEADLPHIFDPFFKGKQTVHELGKEHGSGLGLAIVKSIVEAHGGQVWAENLKDGGVKFWFKIPRSWIKTQKGDSNED